MGVEQLSYRPGEFSWKHGSSQIESPDLKGSLVVGTDVQVVVQSIMQSSGKCSGCKKEI